MSVHALYDSNKLFKTIQLPYHLGYIELMYHKQHMFKPYLVQPLADTYYVNIAHQDNYDQTAYKNVTMTITFSICFI